MTELDHEEFVRSLATVPNEVFVKFIAPSWSYVGRRDHLVTVSPKLTEKIPTVFDHTKEFSYTMSEDG